MLTSSGSKYLDWGAIIAGAVLAAALSFVLLTAGAAIGLSFVSAAEESNSTAASLFAAFWAIAVPIGTLLAGGYIAGRMRTAWSENESEGDFRDGVHGALVWGVSIIVGAFLAASAAGTAGRVTAAAGTGLASVAETAAPAISAMVQATPAPNRPGLTNEQRSQLGGVLARSASRGTLSDADRAYLNQTVAQVTGIPPAEAEKRVNDAYAATVQAVETARKATVATGLVTATALLLSLAAAWYAAQRGGNHRDNNRPARFFTTALASSTRASDKPRRISDTR
jgi:hypothetical protein